MLRLARDGVRARQIGRALVRSGARSAQRGSTIQDNLRRAATAGLHWPLPSELTDAVLEQLLFSRAGTKVGQRRRVEPGWAVLA